MSDLHHSDARGYSEIKIKTISKHTLNIRINIAEWSLLKKSNR